MLQCWPVMTVWMKVFSLFEIKSAALLFMPIAFTPALRAGEETSNFSLTRQPSDIRRQISYAPWASPRVASSCDTSPDSSPSWCSSEPSIPHTPGVRDCWGVPPWGLGEGKQFGLGCQEIGYVIPTEPLLNSCFPDEIYFLAPFTSNYGLLGDSLIPMKCSKSSIKFPCSLWSLLSHEPFSLMFSQAYVLTFNGYVNWVPRTILGTWQVLNKYLLSECILWTKEFQKQVLDELRIAQIFS